jgi:dephospho-CoA kinase
VIDAVVARWGPEVAPDGVVDRSAIARQAFGGDDERVWLEGLLWPRVGARMLAWREEQSARRPAPKALVVEVPLLFEAGMEGAFDTTVVIVADDEIRMRRAGERGHEVLDERSARQLTQEEKAELADHVVANSGTIEQLEQTLSELLEKLRATPR